MAMTITITINSGHVQQVEGWGLEFKTSTSSKFFFLLSYYTNDFIKIVYSIILQDNDNYFQLDNDHHGSADDVWEYSTGD